MHGHYDLGLVALSFFVALLASFSALYFGAQVSTLSRSKGRLWLALGALTMGTGIWTMHFVGMRAHIMPVDISYGLELTLASWAAAVFASALALRIISLKRMQPVHLILGSLIMGGGIASMHYVGMGAMHMDPDLSYEPVMFAVSIAIAIGASAAALLICRKLQQPGSQNNLLLQLTAATVMAIAICGMHYTGMFAVIFPENAMPAADNALSGGWLGVPLTLTISVLIALALIVVGLDMKMRALLQQAEQQQAAKLEQLAFIDPASQLPNRAALEQALLQAMINSKNHDQGFALLYLSMQNYREFEDQLADHDMRQLANRLSTLTQPGDYLARFASNSFALLISKPSAARLDSINKHIHILTSQLQLAGHTIDWRAGISRYQSDGSSSRSLIRSAMANAQAVGEAPQSQEAGQALSAA